MLSTAWAAGLAFKDIYTARDISLVFGHFKQDNPDMVSFNMEPQNKRMGTEVAGLIGWPIVSQLVVTLDYRDGLVDFYYPQRDTR